jgi:hypothetical protein
MKKRITATAFTLATIWVVAQNTSTPNSLASEFPGGALVYLETRDMSALLRDWDTSQEKKLWLASANHEVFSRTRLFMRLGEAQQQFAEAAGFAPDMSLVNSISGGQSAIAIYDIGELEFLYVTRMASARILASTPFAQSKAYESRESAGITYYVRSGTNRRVAAFGTIDGLLFLATRGDLVANALALHARQQSATPLAQDRWYAAIAGAATNPGEVRIALNMPGLLKTPYFRSYWIQRNATELRPFSAGVIDLFREPRQIREERVLIRETQSAPASEQPVAQVIAWAPADAGLYRAWAAPSTDQILNILESKSIAAPSRSAPDAANPDTIAGDTSDLETRIDQAALQTNETSAITALRPIIDAANVQSMLHVQSSRPSADGVFVRHDSAIALLAASNWPAITLPDVQIHRQGRILVLSNSPAMSQRIVSQFGSTAAGNGAAYMARYLHSRELAPFTRMMTQIDAASPDNGEGPRFFSQNVASLGNVLNRVESASITVHDDGVRLTQQMLYRLKQ